MTQEHTQLSIVLKDTRVELTEAQQQNQELKNLLDDNDISYTKKSSKSPSKKSNKSSTRDNEIQLLEELNVQHKRKESILTSLMGANQTSNNNEDVTQLKQTIAQLQLELQQSQSSSGVAPKAARTLSSASREYFGDSTASNATPSPRSPPLPPPVPARNNKSNTQTDNVNTSISFQQLNTMYLELQKKYNDIDIANIELKLESQEKDKRVKELVKTVKTKDHEIEELLSSKHDPEADEERNFADMSEKMLRKKISTYYQKSVDLQEELNAVNVKINQLNDELDEMFDTSKTLKKELKSITTKYTKQTGQVESLQHENEQYKALVESFANDKSTASSTSATTSITNTHIEHELNETKDELIELHEHVHELEEKIESYEKQIIQLTKKNEEIQRYDTETNERFQNT